MRGRVKNTLYSPDGESTPNPHKHYILKNGVWWKSACNFDGCNRTNVPPNVCTVIYNTDRLSFEIYRKAYFCFLAIYGEAIFDFSLFMEASPPADPSGSFPRGALNHGLILNHGLTLQARRPQTGDGITGKLNHGLTLSAFPDGYPRGATPPPNHRRKNLLTQ